MTDEFPAPAEGIVLTHFVVSADVAKSRDFYAGVLGGSVVIAPAPDVRDGTLALVLDPSGAPVALQKWSPQDDEDEGEVSP